MSVYSIASGYLFYDTFVDYLLRSCDHDKLRDATIFVSNAFEVQAVVNAFSKRASNTKSFILPHICVLGDLGPFVELLVDIPEVISPQHRLLTCVDMLISMNGNHKVEQMYRFAKHFLKIVDELQQHSVSYDDVCSCIGILDEKYACNESWKQYVVQIKVLLDKWTQWMSNTGYVEYFVRRNLVLDKITQIMRDDGDRSSRYRIYLLGIDESSPTVLCFVRTLLERNHNIVLFNVDMHINRDNWSGIPTIINHNQYSNYFLLKHLNVDRQDVIDLSSYTKCSSQCSLHQANVINRIMSSGELVFSHGDFVPTFSFITCKNLREEAQMVAMLVRQSFSKDDKDILIVVNNLQLRHWIIMELTKWNIDLYNVYETNLATTQFGSFVLLMLDLLCDIHNVVPFFALFKHSYSTQYTPADIMNIVTCYEKDVRIRGCCVIEYGILCCQHDWMQSFYDKLQLCLGKGKVPFKHLLQSLKGVINLFCGNEWEELKNHWNMVTEHIGLFTNSDIMLPIQEWRDLWYLFLTDSNYATGSCSRIKIMNSVDARYALSDVVIVVSCNEGDMPMCSNADFALGETVRKKLNLKTDEIHRSSQMPYFLNWLCGKEVYCTRAQQHSKGLEIQENTICCWLHRFRNLLPSSHKPYYNSLLSHYNKKGLEDSGDVTIVGRSSSLFLSKRNFPAYLTVSALGDLAENPYVFFIKHILRFTALPILGTSVLGKKLGLFYHDVMCKLFKLPAEQRIKSNVMEIGRSAFESFFTVDITDLPFSWLHFVSTVDGIFNNNIHLLSGYREQIKDTYVEVSGEISVELQDRSMIQIKCIADRIDVLNDGSCVIMDYKLGRDHRNIDIENNPQLSVEAVILMCNGFTQVNVKHDETADYLPKVSYVVLEGNNTSILPIVWKDDITLPVLQHRLSKFLSNYLLGKKPLIANFTTFFNVINQDDYVISRAYKHYARVN